MLVTLNERLVALADNVVVNVDDYDYVHDPRCSGHESISAKITPRGAIRLSLVPERLDRIEL